MSVERARNLRKSMTKAETLLWSRLRNRGLEGFRFRRQHPIGNYVVDFVCEGERLVVELDGGQHATRNLANEARTHWLQQQGYRVIRFWNNDVLQNLEGVLAMLQAALPRGPSPARFTRRPPPKGRAMRSG